MYWKKILLNNGRDSNNQSLSQVVTFANPKIDSWRINLRKYLKSA